MNKQISIWRKVASILLASMMIGGAVAQESSHEDDPVGERKFTIGGYGQLDYNQRVSGKERYNGKLDPHRVVLLLGYQFNPKIGFLSEFEVEHGNEFFVEQAYLKYALASSFEFRGGVMLIPMGLINEFHEPPTFNGVERPSVDNLIVPTTWREMGVGFAGQIPALSLSYQAYLFAGFNGYDSKTLISGKDAFRKARQKAIESYASSPNYSVKLNYNGIDGLDIGLAGYFGKTQSKRYDKMDKSDEAARRAADSTVLGVAMVGVDARYVLGNLELRGEYIYSSLSNTRSYNNFNNLKTDVGSGMYGGYIEAAYNVLPLFCQTDKQLKPFVRYENYDTHGKVDGIDRNAAYHQQEWVAGISFHPTRGVALKVDYQTKKSFAANAVREHYINAGIGLAF